MFGKDVSRRSALENIYVSIWDHDVLAVADYVKVDPGTLQEYIRKRYGKYEVA